MNLILLYIFYIPVVVFCAIASIPLYKTSDELYKNTCYYGRIGVGDQKFNVCINTDLSFLWLLSTNTITMKRIKNYRYKAPNSGLESRDNTIDMYPYHKRKGFSSFDTLSMGSLTILKQYLVQFFLIKSGPPAEVTGFLGMAYDVKKENKSVFNHMVNEGIVNEQKFSLYFNRNSNENDEGQLILGGSDSKHYKNNLTYLNNQAKHRWVIKMGNIYMGKNEILSSASLAVIASGVDDFIYGPISQIKTIHEAIHVTDSNSVNCTSISELPDIHFELGSKNFTLKGEDYIVKVTTDGETYCISCFNYKENVWGTLTENYWTLGDRFLRTVYSVFDIENNRIGFAERV